MVRLALLILLVWTAASVPFAVLVGTLLGRLGGRAVPAPVVVRSRRRVVELSSH